MAVQLISCGMDLKLFEKTTIMHNLTSNSLLQTPNELIRHKPLQLGVEQNLKENKTLSALRSS